VQRSSGRPTGRASRPRRSQIGQTGQASPTPAAAAPAPQALNDTIKRFCGSCHNADTKKGELSLDGFDVARAAEHPEIAEKMVRKLRTGLMPPKTARQPDRATRAALAGALESALDAAAATNPNPGRRVFQRLNRAEYTAAVRALFGIDIDVSSYLPADTISAGFDNIADVQTPSATVMQGYIRAAAYVSRVAVGDPSFDPASPSTTCREHSRRRAASRARRSARAAAPW
jgi:hypothetical protein